MIHPSRTDHFKHSIAFFIAFVTTFFIALFTTFFIAFFIAFLCIFLLCIHFLLACLLLVTASQLRGLLLGLSHPGNNYRQNPRRRSAPGQMMQLGDSMRHRLAIKTFAFAHILMDLHISTSSITGKMTRKVEYCKEKSSRLLERIGMTKYVCLHLMQPVDEIDETYPLGSNIQRLTFNLG